MSVRLSASWFGKPGSANLVRANQAAPVSTQELLDVIHGALVLGKLLAEIFLRAHNALHNSQGDPELAIAASANSDCGDGPEPFRHSEITFWHALAPSQIVN
jgi:hypothetical protein